MNGVGDLAERIAQGMERVVVDAQVTAFNLTVALLARGHVLIEGVPGTGKTLAVRAFSALLGLEFRRIQFTPDLMPADVVGTTVFNPKTTEFTTRLGPIVANVVLADEVNRTPPKTQAALLEAMEEGFVTIDGVAHALPSPFLLCATQNPIEYEGTYPLPEAQLDRFMVKIASSYPAPAREFELLATRRRRLRRARACIGGNRADHDRERSARGPARHSRGASVERRVRVRLRDRRSDAKPSALDARSFAASRRCAAARIAGGCGNRGTRFCDARRRQGRRVRGLAAPAHRGTRCGDRRHLRGRGIARHPRDGAGAAWRRNVVARDGGRGCRGGRRRDFSICSARLRCSSRVLPGCRR